MPRTKIYDNIICWWSGGVTSAVACQLAIDIFGIDKCKMIFMDTHNEDSDTYRFKIDCEKWYNKKIESVTVIGGKFNSIQEVWKHYKVLNSATGAICSSTLKRDLRLKMEKEIEFDHQVFGFDADEPKRARGLKMNHPQTKPLFPLLMYGYNKKDCINIIQSNSISIPRVYEYGFNNNNCFKTGCVQGGIGYWQKMAIDWPAKFNAMSELEVELTKKKGKPVTMLKDQSNKAKESGIELVFLKHNTDYPMVKDISMMKGRPVMPLMECNGFCGTNDLKRNKTENEINWTLDLFEDATYKDIR